MEIFNVDQIISITVSDKLKTHFKWLPRKQKTFLGFKLNKYQEEGYYSYGCYEEGYMGDSWDNTPLSEKDLLVNNYLVDSNTKTVYHKPSVTIYLQSKYHVSKTFETIEDAKQFVESILTVSKSQFISVNRFITVQYENN